ncbi:hypothetical protein CI109_101442 [Kwoniella shandongensis]|uniref:Uncharacterized protein n=1 Tax=Kwoniella shandongensis TaxID=1734106 RepID=A0A5M6BWA2_9TREE|nr:uncharacterized protein CI109_005137 [Kwoniella shandongensis]KAA5526561.1 hypothetical protein CI109_005137 [Kwoniella shandongensis]
MSPTSNTSQDLSQSPFTPSRPLGRPTISRSPVIQPHSHSQSRRSPRLSPILNHHHPQSPQVDPNQPQFAELLTPLKLRRRRNRLQPDQQPTSLPPVAGPSRLGYYTLEGDLFRGAIRDPTVPFHHFVEEDAVSLGTGSTSSSSSNWSWGSGNFERARAVIGRVGEALGVRRGSGSSGSDSSTSDSGDDGDSRSLSSAGGKKRRKRRMSHSHRLSRTFTNLSRQTSGSPERPRRQHLPKRREFTLLLPPKQDEVDLGVRTSVSSSDREAITLVEGEWSPTSLGKKKEYPPDRVITTPSLPVVLDHIRSVRLASGYTPLDTTPLPTPGITPNIAVRRGGSAPGRTRTAKGSATFANPPLPNRPPPGSRTQSRLYALRGDTPADLVRPKSVSDLLGLPSPKSTTSLASMKSEFILPTRPTTPAMVRGDSDGKAKEKPKGCWWLDVSCPGWEDLRDIGELLGLHPLTLEDVLQQDPREKLDTFDKLGYYFLAVRALDESYFKYTPGSANSSGATLVEPPHGNIKRKDSHAESEVGEDDPEAEHKKEGRRRGWGMGRASGKMAAKSGEKVEIIEDNPGKEGLEGVGVGALNVYLVVFADGIVSFHFEDISKHTKRVLERVLTLANPDHGSDWIAHGLLDSIVDAFFPLIRYVDGEVDDIDSLTIDPTTDPKKTTAFLEKIKVNLPESPSCSGFDLNEKTITEKTGLPTTTLWRTPKEREKRPSIVKRLRASFPNAKLYMPRPLVYIRLFFLPTSSAVRRKYEQAPEAVFDRSTMLKRITDMRRLVTGLTRLLGAKGAVINRLRKRAMEEAGTVEAYIGDVEDHILLLQTSLYHYEYILGHCQPAYLSHLNVSFSFARGGTDQAILALSVVAFSILPMQLILGLFSMNIHIPHNGVAEAPHKEPDGSQSPFNYFGGIVVAIFLVACGMTMIIRYWRWLARKKWGKLRGVEVPEFWEAFWGWN